MTLFLCFIPGSHWEPQSSGKLPQKTGFYNNRGSFTWCVVNKEQRPNDVAQEVCVTGI